MKGRQFGAIKRQLELALIIKNQHPEISNMYRECSYESISNELDLSKKYNVSEKDALSGVAFAITGFEGGFGFKQFDGLIDQEKRDKIKRTHQRRDYKKRKITNLEAISEAGQRGALTRGQIPWKLATPERLSEKQRAYLLSEEGMTYPEIAKILNMEYHDGKNVRDRFKIKKAMYNYRKQLEKYLIT